MKMSRNLRKRPVARNIAPALTKLRKSLAGAKAIEIERRIPTNSDADDAGVTGASTAALDCRLIRDSSML
ncbi:hypothetical protein H8B02_40575 [Bradyrhizobium sp. Pear77]|uniref:hypothetical protein n=1 Tax=Bradyrhizobium altum TaxID=1571202 RepID=UPI001E516289|nr:hypothetical protein [Bradyrhizobium altum]MCC8959479.1 hypothetical protein [Bradyrhizobium altum]